MQKITANVSQTCGFVVADHPLLFWGICGCGIEFKFAVPSTANSATNFQFEKFVSIIKHRVAYSARNLIKLSFSDVKKFKNAGLSIFGTE